MKKLFGWVLIIFCSFILLCFVIALVPMVLGVLTENDEVQVLGKDFFYSFIGLLIPSAMSVFGISTGIKKIRKEKRIETIEYTKDFCINLKGRISYRDYRNLLIGLYLRKPIFIVVYSISFLFVIMFLMNVESVTQLIDTKSFFFAFLGVLFLSPFFTIIKIKKLYNTNKVFQEELNYILTNDSINIKGETVESNQKWTHFYQVRVTKDFFMFYQGKMVATLLHKAMFSESELSEFNDFIQSLDMKRA